MRYLVIFLLAITAACSNAGGKGELGGITTNTAANAESRGGVPGELYGADSESDSLAQSSLNNNIDNTSSVHPYANIYHGSAPPPANN